MSVRVVGDGINIRSAPKIEPSSLYAMGRSGRLILYGSRNDIGPTRQLHHSGGHVTGDRHGIGPYADRWDRMFIGGAWRFAACPLTELETDGTRLVELLATAYRPRTVDRKLMAYCAIRAKELAVSFSHTRPDGSRWSSGISTGGGEVLAWNSGRSDPAARLVVQWQGSSGHNDILTRSTFTHIGAGVHLENGRTYGVAILSTRAQP